jgi:hypothetical protein
MGNCTWACGTLGLFNANLFEALANRAVHKLGSGQTEHFKAQELADMTWGFASSGFFHEEFFACVAAVAKTDDFMSQHISMILWSYLSLRWGGRPFAG